MGIEPRTNGPEAREGESTDEEVGSGDPRMERKAEEHPDSGPAGCHVAVKVVAAAQPVERSEARASTPKGKGKQEPVQTRLLERVLYRRSATRVRV